MARIVIDEVHPCGRIDYSIESDDGTTLASRINPTLWSPQRLMKKEQVYRDARMKERVRHMVNTLPAVMDGSTPYNKQTCLARGMNGTGLFVSRAM